VGSSDRRGHENAQRGLARVNAGGEIVGFAAAKAKSVVVADTRLIIWSARRLGAIFIPPV
jgi:hypothetical protein